MEINDPYVWERTLASLYGVAMAEHCSYKSDYFRKNVLPDIGIQLYNLIFKKEAPYSTTHILARDYARRTIEIALLHNPKLFSESEIEEIRPPYLHGGIRDWGEYDYGDKEFDYSGPIHMDFSNYTIGYIVKNGHSYSNPPEKIKVRKQLYWRIYNLGWDKKLFKDAEHAVSNSSYYNGGTERPKVERYGKKYSWIAYYENAGLRDDLGLIEKNWDKFRISGADIDPSFPEKNIGDEFIKHDLLGDRSKPLEDWYEKGGMPFIEEYLSVKSINGIDEEWICLDAFITQEDIPAARKRFIFIRSFLIKDDDYKEALELLEKQDLRGRWLPEKHENYYSYAGELYYCSESTYSNYTNLEFITSTKKVKVKKGEPGYFPLTTWNMDGDKVDIKEEYPEEIEKEVSETKEFEVLMPVMEYNWEGYHSNLNDAGHSTVLAKELANQLNLLNQSQTFDLLDPSGKKASININHHNNFNNNHSMVYLRKDLLEKFLKENNYPKKSS